MNNMKDQTTRMTEAIRNLRTNNPNDMYEFIGKNHMYYTTGELANIIKELMFTIKNCDALGGSDLEDFLYDTAENLGDIYDIYDL